MHSGATVTWAHWGLKCGRRGQLILGLALTVALGLTLGAGIYGATFFMLTGFHGLHVTIGTLMLLVILGRALAGHSGRTTISLSKRCPGTGTSSMWCGCCCLSSCTGCNQARWNENVET